MHINEFCSLCGTSNNIVPYNPIAQQQQPVKRTTNVFSKTLEHFRCRRSLPTVIRANRAAAKKIRWPVIFVVCFAIIIINIIRRYFFRCRRDARAVWLVQAVVLKGRRREYTAIPGTPQHTRGRVEICFLLWNDEIGTLTQENCLAHNSVAVLRLSFVERRYPNARKTRNVLFFSSVTVGCMFSFQQPQSLSLVRNDDIGPFFFHVSPLAPFFDDRFNMTVRSFVVALVFVLCHVVQPA
jgi:hypothetical protein